MKTEVFWKSVEKFYEISERMKAEGRVQHHHALARGYRSLSSGCKLEEYAGRFGDGYVLHVPNAVARCGNRYHWIVYYV